MALIIDGTEKNTINARLNTKTG